MNTAILTRIFATLFFSGLILFPGRPAFADELKRAGSFGVRVAEIPDDLRKQLNVPPGQGILLAEVAPGGSAEASGVLAQDIVLKFNGVVISDAATFVDLVKKTRAGDKVQLALLRAGKPLSKEVLVKARPVETSPDFDILYQSVLVDGTRRRVIVTRPKPAGAYPALFLVTGLGCFSQDNMPPDSALGQILYTLTRNGFVTMRVEKSGMGDSEGPPCTSPQVDMQAETRGYVAGLKALKTYDYVDPDRIFIFGLSIGGTVGPLVANEVPVKGLIVAETVGKSWFEYLLENSRRQHLLSGDSFDSTERLVRLQELCYHRLYIEKQPLEQITKEFPACGQVSYPNTNAPVTYLQQVVNLNLAATWKNINAPVLVIYGTSDYLTNDEEHQYLTKMINTFHPGKAKYVRVENMDHFMERAASQRESMEKVKKGEDGEFNPGILNEMQNWLAEVLQQPGSGPKPA